MAASKTQRKLTAILCADVAGYSRLMGADEEATIETLTAYRKVFLSHIESHSGRVVDAKGDAILAEFASVVDAVSGAVNIQRELGLTSQPKSYRSYGTEKCNFKKRQRVGAFSHSLALRTYFFSGLIDAEKTLINVFLLVSL